MVKWKVVLLEQKFVDTRLSNDSNVEIVLSVDEIT